MAIINKVVRLVKGGAIVTRDIEKQYPMAHEHWGHNSEGDEVLYDPVREPGTRRPGTYVTRSQSVMVVGTRKQLRSWLGRTDYNAALQLEKEQSSPWWMDGKVDVVVPEDNTSSNDMFQPGEHIDGGVNNASPQ